MADGRPRKKTKITKRTQVFARRLGFLSEKLDSFWANEAISKGRIRLFELRFGENPGKSVLDAVTQLLARGSIL
jgi:hypothetical protein